MGAVASLDVMLESLSRCFDTDSARRVLEFQIESELQDRIENLAEQANQGVLSEEERSEYEALINAADLISILKLKAQLRLSGLIQ